MKDIRKLKVSYGKIRDGDYVKLIGCTSEQINCGNNTDPEDLLIHGGVYFVQRMIVKSSAMLAMCGNKSDIQMPEFPRCLKIQSFFRICPI